MRPLSFSIANFKAFGSKPNEIPLRPITLIFGPNSAGKSSLLQALMYFHEVMESGELDVIAPRSGSGKIDLGGFKQVLHRRGAMRHIVIGFTYPAEIIPKPDRNWWPMKQGFTINLTLGPLSHAGELGTKGVSLEIDGQELLRASRVEDGPMKIDLFDFAHPVMSNLLATLGAGRMADPEEVMHGLDMDEYHMEKMVEYFNFAVLRGSFELNTDDLLPRKLDFMLMPDVTDTPDKEAHIRMALFESDWHEHIELFMQDTLPGAFKSLFSAFKGYTRSTLASLRHVPPLRDLPPRVFDLNQHPDPLWRRLANQPELRNQINGWLGADFMKTRYELQVREYAPIDEITSRVPEALDAQMMELFEREGFGRNLEEILDNLALSFEGLNKLDYIKSNSDLYERMIDNEIAKASARKTWRSSTSNRGRKGQRCWSFRWTPMVNSRVTGLVDSSRNGLRNFSSKIMAFHEIAVDPSAIRSWRDFQLVWGKAGFSKGRLIAGFPEKGPDKDRKEQGWAWRVIASVKENEIGSAKRVLTSLEAHAKFKIVKRGRSFNHDETWKANADKEHRRLPFSALIETEVKCDGCRCTLDDLEEEPCPECLRDDQHVMTLPKQPVDLADGLLPMLRCAKALRFVDPYFLKKSESGPGAAFSTKHARVVQEIANRLTEVNRVPQIVEFHMLGLEGDPTAQLSTFAKGMEAFLPKSWEAKAFLWREKLGGRRFHARYILTDVGGAGSEYGWDQGNSPGDQTDLYLLTESVLSQRITDFSATGVTFNLAAGPREFCGIRG
jgi:AAA domain